MNCRSKLIPLLGVCASVWALTPLALADKIDLNRITPVPATEQIPLLDFIREPFMRDPVLNLNGSHVAALVSAGEDKTSYMTYELKTKKIDAWGAAGDSDIEWLQWLDSQRLVFGLGAKKGGAHVMCTADIGKLNTPHPLFQLVTARMFAVPPSERRHPLINLSAGGALTGKYGEVVQADASLNVGNVVDYHSDLGGVMGQIESDNQRHILKRFPILETPGGFDMYYMASKEGQLEFAVTSTDGVLALHRFTGTGWDKCPQDLDEIELFGTGDNPGDVVVLGARANGKPRPLQFMNGATGTPGEVLFEDPAYDFNGWLYRDPASQNIVGAFFDRSGPQVVWFTEGYRVLQKAVDALFPGMVVRIINTDEAGQILLVSTFSDRQPATYRWVDLAAHKVDDVQRSRPWIDPSRMQPMNVLKFKTRDGRKLDAYVTMPAGATKQNPPPLVVLPHDRGYRDSWGYNGMVQLLASRGYAVLQPNYRSSPGYNWMFPTEDEWDFRKMHEDVTDATNYLVKSGLVDGKRVGIVGISSFGGFLALEGAAYEPALYKCAIAVSPVCDWGKTIQERKFNKFTDATYSRMVRKLGDPKDNAAKFEALSPLRRANAVRAAVLISYSEYDPSDLISQAKDMVSEVRKNGVPAESISFLNEGNGVHHLGNKLELCTKIEAFLAQHLK